MYRYDLKDFLFNVVLNQKFTIILKHLDDWDEWFLIIKTMIKCDKNEKFVKLIDIVSSKLIKSLTFIFFDIINDVTFSFNLSIEKRDDLVILRENFQKNLRNYIIIDSYSI